MSSDAPATRFIVACLGREKAEIVAKATDVEGMPESLRWTDGPYTIEQWATIHGTENPAFTLALNLEEQKPVVFGCFAEGDDQKLQLWMPNAPSEAPGLNITPLGVFAPLGDQFGQFPVKMIPDGLEDTLFPENDDVTYAIMDAALMPDLLTRLENEELNHRCLFKNEAAEDLADVAPYLVELPRDENLTRDLFTKMDEPRDSHYYVKDSCIFLQSNSGFDALWAHLRKFTKIRNEEDKWHYLRFWDPSFRNYIIDHPQGPFPRGFFDHINAVICRLSDDQWSIANKTTADDKFMWNGFLPEFRSYFRRNKRDHFVARVGDHMAGIHDICLSKPHLYLLYRQARDRSYETERGIAKQMETLFLWRRDNMSEGKVLMHPDLTSYLTLSDPARAGAILDTTLEILEYKK